MLDWILPVAPAIVLSNMMGKVNEEIYFCGGGCSGVSGSDMGSGEDDFQVSLRILWFRRRPSRSSVQ